MKAIKKFNISFKIYKKKTISFRKLPIYNKKPMSLRKGIGFCQQSEMTPFKIVSSDSLHPIPLKHSYPLTFQLKSLKAVYASIHLP